MTSPKIVPTGLLHGTFGSGNPTYGGVGPVPGPHRLHNDTPWAYFGSILALFWASLGPQTAKWGHLGLFWPHGLILGRF